MKPNNNILFFVILLSIGFGSTLFWSCDPDEPIEIPLPKIETLFPDSITEYTARVGGKIEGNINDPVTSRGIVYCSDIMPTIDRNIENIDAGEGFGIFYATITDLEPETTYYVRAYAKNRAGISYGLQRDFKTIPLPPPAYELTLVGLPEIGGTLRGGGFFEEGDEARVRLTTNDGFEFINWTDGDTGDVVSQDEEFMFTMPDRDVTLNANFDVIDPCQGITKPNIDGYEYDIVNIGDRCLFAENLRTTQYYNGDNIQTGLSEQDWHDTSDGAYVVYPHSEISGINSDAQVVDAYGKLYNWYAVNDPRGICPDGWEVMSDDDWNYIINYSIIVFEDVTEHTVANVLKSCRQDGHPDGNCDTNNHPRWDPNPSHNGVDYFGFSALPGGSRLHVAMEAYLNIGTIGYWWTSTEQSADRALRRNMTSSSGRVTPNANDKNAGYSVRCVLK